MRSVAIVILFSALLAVSSGAFVGLSAFATDECMGDPVVALYSFSICETDVVNVGNFSIITCGADNSAIQWTCREATCETCAQTAVLPSECAPGTSGYGSYRNLCYETQEELPSPASASVVQRIYDTDSCNGNIFTLAFYPNDVCVPQILSSSWTCNEAGTLVTIAQFNTSDCTGPVEVTELPTGCFPNQDEPTSLNIECFGIGNATSTTSGMSTTGGKATTSGMATTGMAATTGDDDTTTGDDAGTSTTSGAVAIVSSIVASAIALLAVMC